MKKFRLAIHVEYKWVIVWSQCYSTYVCGQLAY